MQQTLADVLTRWEIPFRRVSGRDGEIKLRCPFCVQRGHPEDPRFVLGVNVYKGKGHCFRCGWKSTSAVTKVLKAFRIVVYGGVVGDTPLAAEKDQIVKLPADFTSFRTILQERDNMDWLEKKAYRYLRQRGVTDAQLQEKRIGMSYSGRYGYRIVFPVYWGKELRGFVARSFADAEKRYLNSMGTKALYNLRESSPYVVLCEGIFKALRIEHVTGKQWCCVPLLGNSITEEQIELLREAGTKKLVIWGDPDAPGRQGISRVGSALRKAHFAVELLSPVPPIPADDAPIDDMRVWWKNNRRRFGWRSALTGS